MSAGDIRASNAAKELSDVLNELGFMSQLRPNLAIFVERSYWPEELVLQASSPGGIRDMVLIVILDKPKPTI
jgi:hypothetical protein